MRKPQLSESIIIGYAIYMSFTLMVDRNFLADGIESNPDSMYRMYLELLGSQQNVVLLSLAVAFITGVVLFTHNYTVRIISSIVGLVYFTILAVSFVFSYPNLGLGLAAIIVIIIIANVNLLIDEQNERTKKRIICDSFTHENETATKGGDTDGESKER